MLESEGDNPLVDQIADLLNDLDLSEFAEQIALKVPLAITNMCYGCQGVKQNSGFGLSQTNHQFPHGLCLESVENCLLHAMPEAMKLAGIQIPTTDCRYTKLMEKVLSICKNAPTSAPTSKPILPEKLCDTETELYLFTL